MRNGVDISPYQHPRGESIDWQLVANHGYVWMADKINEGMSDGYAVDYPDFAAAAAVGIETVAYHFARPLTCDPIRSGALFGQLCREHAPTSRRCLDLEDGASMGWQALRDWAIDFESASGTDLLYVNRNYRGGLASAGYSFVLDLWLAYPDHNALDPDLYAVQFGQGWVPGIPAVVDLNLVADLPPTPTPQPPPTTKGTIMDEEAIYRLVKSLYADHGNGDVPVGAADQYAAIVSLPRDQWGAAVGKLATELAHPAPPA